MSSPDPGQHPYARAYEKAAGEPAQRAFVPPFRAPAGPPGPDERSGRPDSEQPQEDPDLPRVVREHPRGFGISRAALVLVALALGLGLLIGRVSVNSDPATVAPTAAASTTPVAVPLGPRTLQETGAKCARQVGSRLQLGVEVRNVSTGPVILQQLRVNLPSSGLALVGTGVGACGELNVPNLKDFGLSTQGTVWLSATLQVDVPCPSALPVSMSIYASDETGRVQPMAIAGFANLKDVGWSGCTAKATTKATAKPGAKSSARAKSSKSPSR